MGPLVVAHATSDGQFSLKFMNSYCLLLFLLLFLDTFFGTFAFIMIGQYLDRKRSGRGRGVTGSGMVQEQGLEMQQCYMSVCCPRGASIPIVLLMQLFYSGKHDYYSCFAGWKSR